MTILRLIARLDIKGPNVVKGVQMEGLRIMGKPWDFARRYAEDADELLYVDTVASLYGRNQLGSLLEQTAHGVFVPITVMGGLRSLADVKRVLDSGADKVAVNSAAIGTPRLIREISDHYGSQAIAVSIEAKRKAGGWECFTDNGRQATGKSAQAWATEAVTLGAGEVLLTSVDRDGTRKGFDVELVRAISDAVDVPVVACGGMGGVEHLRHVLVEGRADAVAVASVLHYGLVTFKEMHDVVRREFAKGKLHHERIGRAGAETGRPEGRIPEEGAGIHWRQHGIR